MRRNKRGKIKAILILVIILAACLTAGCGKKKGSKEGHITLISELPEADISIPAYLVGSEADEFELEEPESYDPSVPEDIVIFQMDGGTRTEVVNRLASGIEKSLENILEDKESYPDITDIDVNGEGDTFTVHLEGKEMNTYESSLQLGLIIAGNKYQIYKGVPMEEVLTRVIFIDDSTGQEILRTDSGRMAAETGRLEEGPQAPEGAGQP